MRIKVTHVLSVPDNVTKDELDDMVADLDDYTRHYLDIDGSKLIGSWWSHDLPQIKTEYADHPHLY